MSTVLVVDDDKIILNVTEELLNMLGYEVCTAQSGEVALEIVSSKKNRIDLALLDISLPDMDGLTLFPKLLAKQPDLKILLTSGNLLEISEESLKQQGVEGFLQKPYSFKVLKSTLEKLLSAN